MAKKYLIDLIARHCTHLNCQKSSRVSFDAIRAPTLEDVNHFKPVNRWKKFRFYKILLGDILPTGVLKDFEQAYSKTISKLDKKNIQAKIAVKVCLFYFWLHFS